MNHIIDSAGVWYELGAVEREFDTDGQIEAWIEANFPDAIKRVGRTTKMIRGSAICYVLRKWVNQ